MKILKTIYECFLGALMLFAAVAVFVILLGIAYSLPKLLFGE